LRLKSLIACVMYVYMPRWLCCIYFAIFAVFRWLCFDSMILMFFSYSFVLLVSDASLLSLFLIFFSHALTCTFTETRRQYLDQNSYLFRLGRPANHAQLTHEVHPAPPVHYRIYWAVISPICVSRCPCNGGIIFEY